MLYLDMYLVFGMHAYTTIICTCVLLCITCLLGFMLFLHSFDVKDCVTGFGNPDWKRTHEAAGKTAVVVTALLKNGATCVGKTVMDEFAFGYMPFL